MRGLFEVLEDGSVVRRWRLTGVSIDISAFGNALRGPREALSWVLSWCCDGMNAVEGVGKGEVKVASRVRATWGPNSGSRQRGKSGSSRSVIRAHRVAGTSPASSNVSSLGTE